MLTILIADDDAGVRALLKSALTKWGHKIVSAENGKQAWEILKSENKIDAAILDWHMGEMSGPEICLEHTRQDNARFVYKIILSGIMQRSDIFQALHMGAHDVLEKPCDLPLIRSRLTVAEKIVQEKRTMEELAQTMERWAKHMETLAEERAQQLVHAERMSSLGVMASGIAHEINNPMSFISGNVQHLQRFWNDLSPYLSEIAIAHGNNDKKIKTIFEETPKILESIMKGVQRVTKIVHGLRKYSGRQKKSAVLTPFSPNECIQQAFDLCKGSIGSETKVHFNLSNDVVDVLGDGLEIEQVLINLMVNAGHAMEKSQNKELIVTSLKEEETIVILVEDSGPGIPPEVIDKIWDPFFTTKPVGKGTGLGLSIVSGIVKAHSGTIKAYNKEKGGACIELKLPVGAIQ